MSASAFLSTTALACTAGVGRETLRFYETRGLIKPVLRTAAGYRQYDNTTVERIAFIRQTQQAGFTLKEIRQLLQLHADHTDTCGTLSSILGGKLRELDAHIAAMQIQRTALVELTQQCTDQPAARHCKFVDGKSGC